MTALTRPDRSDHLAWLALSALVLISAVLGAGAWVALAAADRGAMPRRVVDACLLISQSLAESFGSWATAHPFTALALVFLGTSMAWSALRLGLSLSGGWRLGHRLSEYEAGQFPLLDRALRQAPEVRPAHIRVLPAMTPEAFTLGLIRPKICLSAGLLRSMTEAEIEAVLRHEHAHVIARDPLRLAAVRLLSDFLWFLPITRILAFAFSGLAELRADERAIAAGSDSLELASVIVKAARRASHGPHLAPALGGAALVERRIMRLLGRERATPLRIPWVPGLLSGLMMTALLALLVSPAFGTGRAHSADPMAAMHSMMTRCAAGNRVGLGYPMDPNHCREPGSVRATVRQGFGI